jgi:branched-chain amino acid transport system ATP-binding protein
MNAPILSAKNVHVSFGGVRAADDVALDIFPGEFLAIIGPNGSGKTTFLNLCTGYVRPTGGSISLAGREIAGLTPRAITRLGIARSFQHPQLFTEQSLLENVLLAIAARRHFWSLLRPLARPAYVEEALSLIELIGLRQETHTPVVNLPEGMRKLTDIALALALKPQLLLLDEPTSGVSSDEKFAVMDTLVSALRRQSVTAAFVEHDIELVRKYADRVAVWDQGRVLAAGDPAQILSDARVMQAVVGVD